MFNNVDAAFNFCVGLVLDIGCNFTSSPNSSNLPLSSEYHYQLHFPKLFVVYNLLFCSCITARKTEVCSLVTSLRTVVNKTVCRGEQNLQTQMFMDNSLQSSYHLGFHVVCKLQTLLSTLQTILFTLQTMVYNLETLR